MQVIGDNKTTLNLCNMCLEKQGLDNPLIDISKVFGKIIIALLSELLTSKFQQTFHNKMDSMLFLKKKLREAIQEEKYELAADLRDQIRAIENKRSIAKFT